MRAKFLNKHIIFIVSIFRLKIRYFARDRKRVKILSGMGKIERYLNKKRKRKKLIVEESRYGGKDDGIETEQRECEYLKGPKEK